MDQILKTLAYEFPYVGNFLAVFNIVPHQPYGCVTWEHYVVQSTYNQLLMGQRVQEPKFRIRQCAESIAAGFGRGLWQNKYLDQGELFKTVVAAHAYAVDYKEDQKLNFVNKPISF